jgi:hypothetical protein
MTLRELLDAVQIMPMDAEVSVLCECDKEEWQPYTGGYVAHTHRVASISITRQHNEVVIETE